MKIDFVSDVSCPWCAIGLNALEQALARVAPDIQATMHFQPFELNPQMPGEGQDVVEHLSQKYGIDAKQIAANAEAIRQRGAGVGFTFGQGMRRRIYNTFDAHRLLHWAGTVGLAEQRALKEASAFLKASATLAWCRSHLRLTASRERSMAARISLVQVPALGAKGLTPSPSASTWAPPCSEDCASKVPPPLSSLCSKDMTASASAATLLEASRRSEISWSNEPRRQSSLFSNLVVSC